MSGLKTTSGLLKMDSAPIRLVFTSQLDRPAFLTRHPSTCERIVKLLALAVAVLSIVIPLAGCADSASAPASVPVGDEAAIRATLDAFL